MFVILFATVCFGNTLLLAFGSSVIGVAVSHCKTGSRQQCCSAHPRYIGTTSDILPRILGNATAAR